MLIKIQYNKFFFFFENLDPLVEGFKFFIYKQAQETIFKFS